MGIYDRDYVTGRGEDSGTMRMGVGFREMGVVKWLLIINFVVFILTLSEKLHETIFTWGVVYPQNWLWIAQIWRLLTYQFLHWNAFHFLFNMFGLFFFGPILEHLWGSRAFLRFYLISGAAGGFMYTLLVIGHVLPAGLMAGASGGIYAVFMAVAIMFPRMMVLIYGIIPVRIGLLVIIMIIISLLKFASGQNAGGEAAHLTGLAAGAIYVLYKPWFTKSRLERKKGSWAKKIERERRFEAEVDRILEKVNREGIGSLSEKEKQTLQEATRREQADGR
jgi:membrane associated rhomboid family serine protease